MAREIQVQLSFRASKGGATIAFQDSFRQDMDGDNLLNNTQEIGTDWEVVNYGDVGSQGQVVIKNLDLVNFVEIRQGDSGVPFAIILPGKFLMWTPTATDFEARADTIPVRILVVMAET
jgi:hypothetical protein